MKKFVIITIMVVVMGVVWQLSGLGNKSILETYKLEALSVEEMVEALETSSIDKSGLTAYINSSNLVLETERSQTKVALPEGKFYISMAPYIEMTHTCLTHYLTSCRGELQNEEFHVKFVAEDGTIILEETLNSASNGFIGVWLPTDVSATLHIEYKDYHVKTEISTFAGDPTCITTPLQLVRNDSINE
jgi:hypothetical protein